MSDPLEIRADSLVGRVVVIAQAHTEAGAAVARAVCEAGATAVLVGDGFARLGAVAAEIHGDTAAPIMIFAGDLRSDESRVVLAELVSELAAENLTEASATR